MELGRTPALEASAGEGTYVVQSIDWSQTEPGTFDVKYGVVDAAPLVLSLRTMSVGFNVTADVMPQTAMIGMLADSRTRCRWFGLDVGLNGIATSRTSIDLRTLGPSSFYTVSVDDAQLARMHPNTPDAVALLENTQSARLSQDAMHARRLRSCFKQVFQIAGDSKSTMARLPAGSVYGTLVPLLAAAIEGLDGRAIEPSRCLTRRLAAVRDCEAYMREHTDETITLLDLSRISGLRSRTLINAFDAVTGFSPMTYLRRLRLSRVNHDLRFADKARTRIIDVATSWGFWHMGHFAAEYHAMFGERPSETLLGGRG